MFRIYLIIASISFAGLYLLVPVAAQQRQVTFKHLTAQDGLSSEKIRCLMQDRRGFIWIGTNDGLNRYDGTEIKVFQRAYGDPNSLSHNSISVLYEDSKGLIWIGTNGGGLNSYDPVQDRFISFQANPSDPMAITSNRVMSIWEDEEQNLWLGTGRGGLNRWNKSDSTFSSWLPVPYKENNSIEQLNNSIRAIAPDATDTNTLWLGSFNGLYRFDRSTFQFTYHHPQQQSNELRGTEVTSIFSGQNGTLWMSYSDGEVSNFDPTTNGWNTFSYLEEVQKKGQNSPTLIRQIAPKSDSENWICSYDKGLGVFDIDTQTFDFFVSDPYNPSSILPGAAHCVLTGTDGVTWIGTYQGLSLIDPQAQLFEHVTLNANLAPDPRNFKVEGIIAPGDNHIYLGTPDADGFYVINKTDHRITSYPYYQDGDGTRRLLIRDLYHDIDAGTIWILDYKKLLQFDRKQKRVIPSGNQFLSSIDLEPYDPIEIFKDSKRNFWIGTSNSGVLKIEAEKKKIVHFTHDPSDPNSLLDDIDIHHIMEDSNGNIWMTSNQGVSRLSGDTGQFTNFKKDQNDPNSLSFHTTYALLEDDDQHIWVGTLGGLNKIDNNQPDGKKVTVYTKADGLPNDRIFRMIKDQKGFIWLATENGLSRLNPKTMVFRNFDNYDGLKSNLMNHPMERSSEGEILFGYPSGVSYFHPDSLQKDTMTLPIIMTSLKVFDREVPLEKGIDYLDRLDLTYDQNSFSFTFSGLNYRNPQKNQYAYRLEGFDTEWILSEKRNFASYTNVGPGKYTFSVKGTTNSDFSMEASKSISITISTPWWQTWWAYLTYAALFITLVYFIYRFQRSRWLLQTKLELEQQEAHRLKELDEFKSRLYTDITHEFRTPLTVIQGMADQLPELVQMDDRTKYLDAADLIKRNGGNLLQLINQMLDLAKLESNNLPLAMIQGDVVSFLKYLVSSFQSFASSQKVTIRFEASPELIHMDYDPEQLQKIVSNLLSNAIKFTPIGGQIHCTAGQSELHEHPILQLSIADTGIGINSEDLPHIFDRFYQVNASGLVGSGIGLALTKELTKLMGGNIAVASEKEKGTTFTLTLPITNTAPLKDFKPAQIETYTGHSAFEPSSPLVDSELPMVLIIEDNQDVASYLSSVLQKDYQLYYAPDGNQGIETALDIVPDIIVSDVMMPHKDGFEVCEFLKNDQRTSHIPVVLLTAKAGIEDKIAGLKRGADAYLAKPFHKEELLVSLANLLALRKQLQTIYANGETPSVNSELASPMEDEFITKMKEVIDSQLSNGDFGVQDFCQELGMSRTQVHRKLKALTNYSTSHWIRAYRLKKAKALLQTSNLTISEVAYEVGFNNPSYFHRTFVQEYGMKPSQVRK